MGDLRKYDSHYIEPSVPLASRGRRFCARSGPLLSEAIRVMPACLIDGMGSNMKDNSYLSVPQDKAAGQAKTSDGGIIPDDTLFFRMSMLRGCVLASAVEDFRSFGLEMGWSRRAILAAAKLMMPIWDLSERLCVGYYGHQHRAMEYGKILLDQRGVQGEDRAIILMGTLLHDIGKAAVPAGMQRVRGRRRTTPEIEEMDKHPANGKSIIVSASASLAQAGISISHIEDIAEVAYSHQMTFDGLKGYPPGPIGISIPIGGRIAAFCDSFDTMTSIRIYNQHPKDFALAKADAFDNLDTQFNSNIVRDFFVAAESGDARLRIASIITSAGGAF